MASSPTSTRLLNVRTGRRPSWTSTLTNLTESTESSEPRHPPPEFRHQGARPKVAYIQDQLDAEHALDADESETEDEEDEDGPGDLGLSMSTRILDGQSTDERPFRLGKEDENQDREQGPSYTRGRRQPSTGSSEVDIEVAPGSSMSSVSKSHTEPASPGFGSNMRRSLQIDMKNLVGDSVANMSISPGSRDIVLAARRGMYIIDLETPLEVPRFLPQGGTWDVADVQWNPHPARAEYIVSTSAERLLIWNLLLAGKSNIQHILQAHYRAVTDINWHTTECDTVVSTGVDSWVWAWDLRDPKKPIFGLSAFKSGGTQVKWNRQDGNVLASSHANGVYIWDRRKGSLPVIRIRAHKSKIYGIDWSHDTRNEIITCSLDRSIKVWDITESSTSSLYNSGWPASSTSFAHGNSSGPIDESDFCIYGPVAQCGPKRTINTLYPVWRARNLPFGKGVLSLAQRGQTALEMYALNGPMENNVPVETFEGHTDVVKEFLWRKSDHDEFQLITWSKDRTLKFWPIDIDVMQKVGYDPNVSKPKQTGSSNRVRAISFRNPLDGVKRTGRVGNRPIVPDGHAGSPSAEVDAGDPFRTITTRPINEQPGHHGRLRGETMSRGPVGSVARMDAFTWLTHVKVGDRKETNSGAASRETSQSRISSSSKSKQGDKSWNGAAGSAQPASTGEGSSKRKGERSESMSGAKESQDTSGQALQDEITTVLTKMAEHKIKLEKHDLTKRRTCTLGLHGPWGENVQLQVFIRVTFTFPRDYPYAKHPHGIPVIDVERNPLIPMRNRAFMLRRLRTIRERRRPCLEACLRFLLFGDEEERSGPALHLDSESSSDEDFPSGEKKKRKKDVPAISILRDHKNLAEPRTSQGTFGPNGELVCFFRASPRIVRNVLRGLTNPSANTVPPDSTPLSPPRQLEDLPPSQSFPDLEVPGALRSPSLVSEATRKLAAAARDRGARSPSGIRREGAGGGPAAQIEKVLTCLMAFAQQRKARRDSEGSHQDMSAAGGAGGVSGADARRKYPVSLSPSAVFFVSANDTAGPDKKVASGYVYASEDGLGEVCERNASNARAYGRYDHERVFKVLKTLFLKPENLTKGKSKPNGNGKDKNQTDKPLFSSETMAKHIILRLYSDFAKNKDIQMLAMLSMLILQTFYCSSESQAFSLSAFEPSFPPSPDPPSSITPTQNRLLQRSEGGGGLFSASSMLTLPKMGSTDYFSIARAINSSVIPPSSPDWPRLPSTSPPPLQVSPNPITTRSSRGAWSSLFAASGVRQLVQDTFNKDGFPASASNPTLASEGGRLKGEKRLLRPVSAGGAEVGRALSLKYQDQQLQQKKGRQKRHSTQIQQGSILSGAAPLTRSSTEIMPMPLKASLSVSSTSSSGSSGMRRSPLVSVGNLDLINRRGQEQHFRKVVAIEEEESSPPLLFDRKLLEQFKAHVNIYAEILHRWKLDHQRLALLKAISTNIEMKDEVAKYPISITRTCTLCLTPTDKGGCATCGSHVGALQCSVCRLPVKGLSRTCLLCYHVTHISCLKAFNVTICPTGCGCMCDAWYGEPENSSIRPSVGMAAPSVSNSGHQQAPSTRASSVVPPDTGFSLLARPVPQNHALSSSLLLS